ncbi:MAG TPA: polyphosphate kinase 2 family protein [Candidatus Competibacteraceae bacterium]|nr:polyphosphate kinase 2 family protein [Candidatus Competibacteraceae bacterium]HQA26046.1 polyphosphate kinase 2 family protein [Candidatus Competibacteraceae bacterium]HQD55051.1 polyphosphate kinase 2 family protein [Candidatus Competibacteraceae bacterium]
MQIDEDSELELRVKHIMVPPGHKISLHKDYDPAFTANFKNKKAASKKLAANIAELAEYQDILYAQDTYALLIVFQAMDAAGKDGAIKHVMSGVNPQGCQVFSFKAPSAEDLDHDYLWRSMKCLPERGRIGIFNRSYYEEVLVVRVHPELLEHEKLPSSDRQHLWKRRYDQINAFEKYLFENGIIVLKFFLNVSKDEQKKRFLDRIDHPEKNWKFSTADIKERGFWDDYQAAYEDCLNHTSTEWAPWFVVPADSKWFTRLAVSEIIARALKRLNLRYPEVDEQRRQELQEIRKQLEAEG